MVRWGVYNIQGLDGDGRTVDANDRSARKWSIRWRVDDAPRKRTLETKGFAKTFRDQLLRAQLMGWDADSRGWPLDPSRTRADERDTPGPADSGAGRERRPAAGNELAGGRRFLSVRAYCEGTWWPIVGPTFNDKNGLGHRTNMRLALDLLTYAADDPRVFGHSDVRPGDSILLEDLVADDLGRALVARRSINLRVRAANNRRVEAAYAQGLEQVDLRPEETSAATVRSFFITIQMFVRAAMRSGHIVGDPLAGLAALAPAPRGVSMTDRVVPSVSEVFDLADAISGLGPRAGRFCTGDRFRSLVLVGGTLGARPGELVAHRPEWIDWAAPTTVRFHETEAPFYDSESGPGGLRTRPLKHRQSGDYREVPALDAVADALKAHIERGYTGHDRTWTSPTGRGRLNWGNLTEVYWRPACERVFAGTDKAHLVTMSPKMLRKAAITFWLDSDISPYLAAEWAGHSEDVARRHYAGRAAPTYASEVARLGRHSGR